ncbi:hypothetical protein [Bacillus vallismortis]|uniref:hypothetical protein n=1 Tax=Bacillus vallismortis TaxID=72361 RepID=UPI0002881911|nr:hypothetical protein [Bacillus vallismortis]MBG9768849.1 hypothetical protein [Bacillus vallismortis]QAV10281.1 hypothetical protein BV11031_17750 [Bacillus vallismortis]
MEWSKVFDLLKTILTSWPLAAVVIVFAIRKSLNTVIENRLFSFKVGNVEIIFDRLLEKVDQNLEEASQLSEEVKVDSKSVKESENTQTEKPQYVKPPRIIIRESWKEVAIIIRNLIIEREGKAERTITINSINYLTRILPDSLAEALFNLLKLRDLLLDKNNLLTRDDALLFRTRCLNTAKALSKYTQKSNVEN